MNGVILPTVLCFLGYVLMGGMVIADVNVLYKQGEKKSYSFYMWLVTFILVVGFCGMFTLFKMGFEITNITQ
ncbi:hypothetical protein ABC382_00390 [Lysinibacillus sp. 1P01SD]|uniref:hypothetical protein n=1 Tax=Lysinibacillus sp. 1P01SD TaxID=3132285 RepID=UPI0039A28787